MSNVAISDDVLFQELEGDSVLLHIKTENYFGLDSTGTRIWQLLSEHNNTEGLIKRFLAEYDVDEVIFRQDLNELLEQLASKKLITMQAQADENDAIPSV